MAHFAEINENNIVTRVLVVEDDQENRGQDFLAEDLGLGGTWLKTSYNTHRGVHLLAGTPFRKNYAGIGYSYNPTLDAFIPPKVFASWVLDEDTCDWNPPITIPVEEGKRYIWNEDIVNWQEVVEE